MPIFYFFQTSHFLVSKKTTNKPRYLSLMLICHWMLTPVMASQLVVRPYWAGVIVFVVSTSFWTLFYIAQEPWSKLKTQMGRKFFWLFRSWLGEMLRKSISPLGKTPTICPCERCRRRNRQPMGRWFYKKKNGSWSKSFNPFFMDSFFPNMVLTWWFSTNSGSLQPLFFSDGTWVLIMPNN